MNIHTPPFQTLQYIPVGERETMLDFDVLWVDAVAHGRLPDGGNHWCFYLRVSNDRSVCVNITPSYSVPAVAMPGGSKAIMIISHLPNSDSDSATTKAVRLDVQPNTKVRDFVDQIVNRRRHQYEFDAEGRGCRFWTEDQVELFRDVRLLVNGSQVTEAKSAIRTQYPDEVQYPLVVGSYYP